jgi:alpha-1,6-mannosyltransferase
VTHIPSLKLYGLAGIMLAALVACAYRGTSAASFFGPLAFASAAYLLAVREFFRTPGYPRHVLLICLALAALWRIPFLKTPLGPDDDIARYIWDGRMQRLGYNPYTVIPADPALATLHTPETRGLNNPEVPTPYPAGAQLFFRAVTAIHESAFAFKIAFAVCDIGIVLVLFELLRRSGQGVHWILAYAWHPLLATDVAGSGHIDILGVLLLLVSVAALGCRWRSLAAITLSLAVAVKFLPIVLVPLYWRRVRIRDGLMAAFAFAVLYAPFLKAGGIPIGSLATYVQRFRFNGPVFASLERLVGPPFAAGMAVLVGLVTAGWLRTKPPRCSAAAWAWPMAASLACAPVVYPWYLLWLLPFLRSLSTLPLTVWTVSILLTYSAWYLRSGGHEWQVPGWVLLLEYGSAATAAAIVCLRHLARPAGSVASGD